MMFQNQINEQIQRVRRSPYAALLGEQVYSRLEKALQDMAGTVSKSTLNREIAKEASEDNPFALSLPEMITDEERRRAIDTIEKNWRGENIHFQSRWPNSCIPGLALPRTPFWKCWKGSRKTAKKSARF